MTRHQIALIIAYDGTRYFGWQTTKEGQSIESTLQTVLEKITQEKICLRAASRTDRGVHAERQVVDFFTTRLSINSLKFQTSLNRLLPPDIVCREAFFLNEGDFHPSTSALHKTYRYSITTGSVQLPHVRHTHWHVHFPLDMTKLNQCRNLLLGTKDFRSFANHNIEYAQDNTTRTVLDIIIQEYRSTNSLEIFITGNAFLYRMARNIVGTMILCARNKIQMATVERAFITGNRTLIGMTAPAHGLSLLNIAYPKHIF